jgi:Ni,Fe-hydrogenase III large subunit
MELSRRNCMQRAEYTWNKYSRSSAIYILPYNSETPEPAALKIFLKGFAILEIDKSLIVNGRVLTMLAHKHPLHDVDTCTV